MIEVLSLEVETMMWVEQLLNSMGFHPLLLGYSWALIILEKAGDGAGMAEVLSC
jgi:hypothetical protein